MIDATGIHRSAPLQAPSAPAWSPDGSRLVVEAGGVAGTTLAIVDPRLAVGDTASRQPPGDARPAWGRLVQPRPGARAEADPDELLPDLDQRAPRGLVVGGGPGRWTLGFASAVDNVGRGPLWSPGARRSLFATRMDADQKIRLRSGGTVASRGSAGCGTRPTRRTSTGT